MWAACCNWLCLDTEPQEIPQGGRTQTYSNPNVRTTSPISEVCRACGTSLQAPIRKNPCMDCKKNHCVSCLAQPNNGIFLCQVCRRIRSTSFLRDELMKLKVKDLRDYLSLRDIPTDLCREKEDLVQLVLTQKPPVIHADVTSVPPYRSHQSSPNQQADIRSSPMQPSHNVPTTNRNSSSNPEATAGVQTGSHADEESESSDSEVLVPGRRASLSDLNSLDDIETLSVRQLKEILARNFVNYKGCCEKWELMERVTRLYNEQKDLQEMVSTTEAEGKPCAAGEENICKVCMDSPIDCVLLECGHMVTCTKCGKRMSECPICRQYVVRAVHVFRS
ncbi:E3 ubiquitin-protein ligase rififylin [Rhinophrynus dorsalis]